MEPQRPHQRFIRPPSYGGSPQDSRTNTAPPPRPYGPPSSMPAGRSQPPYDPFRRAESETQQTRPLPPFSYPMSQHQPKPQSPVPYPPPHNESSSGFHSRQSSHDSIKQHSDGGVKDYNTVYREGRMILFMFIVWVVFRFCRILPGTTWSFFGRRHGSVLPSSCRRFNTHRAPCWGMADPAQRTMKWTCGSHKRARLALI
jgi:hypothetical protein